MTEDTRKVILRDGKVYEVTADGEKELTSQTDWEKLDALTDEEIERSAEEDGTGGPLPVKMRAVQPFDAAE